ncbi:hypothetical protein OsI_02208 [Oryza sativa Indica Group]|uniref:Uncharacterized protein n=3 Tax=Oryza TaxID=4527 RepID=A0A0D3EPL8_9ORYZ|nr:uncharacterized protein LOC127760154 [Oryza glaberrima]EAY74320.1 hypothetical protein OsI_02208 [Oryza sativa Indica Group]
MVWKAALAALLLFMVVAANGEVGHGGHAAVPLRRSLGLGWMTGLKGGPPTGMQPSSIRPAATGEGGRRLSSEGEKFIHTLPAFKRPPIPPTSN